VAADVTRPKNEALGEFLSARRARIKPSGSGPAPAGSRRVPGLRREELARLAGVSFDYYARLEQGRQPTASPSVLDALAQALALADAERAHMYDLAGVPLDLSSKAPLPVATQRAQRIMSLLDDTPAIMRGRFMDITMTNRAACFLFDTDFNSMPAAERNGLRWMLFSAPARELYGADWADAAAEMIGILRLYEGREPDHPRLRELVSEFTARSATFRRVWREHHVSDRVRDRKSFQHPRFGSMKFFIECMTVHSLEGQTLVTLAPADRATFQAALDQRTPSRL
jgi:transcriptional regulator with XRE-family HTH domain